MRFVRCANLLPFGASDSVTRAQLSYWVAQPGPCIVNALRHSTTALNGDELGGVAWDEECWLPLPAGPVTIQLELVYTVAPSSDSVTATAEHGLQRGCGSIILVAQPKSSPNWCRLEGMGSPRLDGVRGGSAELQFEVLLWRPHGDSAESPLVAQPSHDHHGFPLRVQPRVYAEFAEYWQLRAEVQGQRWVVRDGSLPDLPTDGAQAELAVAQGLPPHCRPALWMQLSGAEALMRAACTGDGAGATNVAVGALDARHCSYSTLLDHLPELLAVADGPGDGTPLADRATIARQVEIDLERTFPDHVEFQAVEGRDRLRRVLLAHGCRNPVIGYTQSLNFVAAFLLLQMPTHGATLRSGAHVGREEGAFWMLCAVTELLLPDHFTPEMNGVRTDTGVLEEVRTAVWCHRAGVGAWHVAGGRSRGCHVAGGRSGRVGWQMGAASGGWQVSGKGPGGAAGLTTACFPVAPTVRPHPFRDRCCRSIRA